MIRVGLWRAVVRNRWIPVINTGAIGFKRELRLLRCFRLETRIVGWDEIHFVIRQDVLLDQGRTVAATALVRAGLYDRRRKAFVATKELLRITGSPTSSPAVGAEIHLMTQIGRLTR